MPPLAAIGVLCVFGLASAFDYCALSSSNTLCLFQPNITGPACGQVLSVGVTAADQKLIVDLHNQMRRRVAKGLEWRGSPGPQPPAANMRQLQWDDELALMAQTHANQCVFRHDIHRDVERFAVGQNVAIQMSTAAFQNADWSSQIQNWYDEVRAMDRSYVDRFPWAPGRVIGHYTQVAWAETSAVGCGAVAHYETSFQTGFPFQMLYVCNYGRAGNYIDRPVYRSGPAASACPDGTAAVDGLCVDVEENPTVISH